MRPTISVLLAFTACLSSPPCLAAAGDPDPAFAYPRPAATVPDSTNAVPLPDGYLVIRAVSTSQATTNLDVTRIDRDGHVVASFGSGGSVANVVPGPTNLSGAAVTLRDGSFVIGGMRDGSGSRAGRDRVAAIARLAASGRIDTAFGTDGVATVNVPGELDRVAAVGEMADGRIAVLVWSRIEELAWDCDYRDRATLVTFDARGQVASQSDFIERYGYGTESCRTTLTLRTLPDGGVRFGSETGISDGANMLTTPNWRYGPFAIDETLGLINSVVQGSGIEVPYPSGANPNDRIHRSIGWAVGYEGPITWHVFAVDAAREVVYAGFSTDGGEAGVARFLMNGHLDSAWNGDGIVAIEGSGQPGILADYGLAADIRLIDVQPDGAIVVVTADGIIERFLGGADPAHGTFVLTSRQVLGEGGEIAVVVSREGGSTGAVSVEYEAVSCEAEVAPSSLCAVTTWPPASPGPDFPVQAGRLDWSDGDATPRTVMVRTIDDGEVESDEMFSLQLRDPAGGATIVSEPISLFIRDAGLATGPGVRPGNAGGGGTGGGGGGFDGWMLLALLMLARLSGRSAR